MNHSMLKIRFAKFEIISDKLVGRRHFVASSCQTALEEEICL